MLYVVMPAFAWMVLARQREWPVRLWCAGGLATGGSFLLIGLRGAIPDLLSFALGNLLLFVGTQWRCQALRLDLGVGWRYRRMALAALCYGVVYELIRQNAPVPLRLKFIYILYIALFSLIAHLAWLARRIAAAENSPSANWVSRVYVLVAATGLFRWLSVIGGAGAPVLVSGLDTQMFTVALALAAVVGHIGFVGLALDRSLRREKLSAVVAARDEETRRLAHRIAHLDRQRSLGAMAASLGRELDEPLQAILGSSELARNRLAGAGIEQVEVNGSLDAIVASTRRASQTIRRIRAYISPTEQATQPTDLAVVVREASLLFSDELRSGRLALSLPTGAPVWVMGDSVHLTQLVVNVFRNALQAAVHPARCEIAVGLQVQQGRALLRISDSGPGFKAEQLRQDGADFSSTGAGLGLSICRSIARQFDATLTLSNSPTGGAVVELDLPHLQPTEPHSTPTTS